MSRWHYYRGYFSKVLAKVKLNFDNRRKMFIRFQRAHALRVIRVGTHILSLISWNLALMRVSNNRWNKKKKFKQEIIHF